MIIQGGKTMEYCADCCRTPVANYGNLCACCQSIREAKSMGHPVYIWKAMTGILLFTVGVLAVLLRHH